MWQGNSWVAQFMKDAKADYLWADVEGTGTLVCRLKILEKSQNCQILIATGSLRI
jgi:iron complex transport system substrate-binding protein